VGGLIAYVLWFRGIGRLPVTSVAFLAPLSPMVAAAIGVGVLGESLSGMQVAGFALALAAVLAGQLPPRGRRAGRGVSAPARVSTTGLATAPASAGVAVQAPVPAAAPAPAAAGIQRLQPAR
jgi:probable blue pigment (indigoidine) exporter